MKCPNCGFENRPGARFCGRCGESVAAASQPPAGAPHCPQCGEEVRPGARFCPHCGHTLGEPAPPARAEGPQVPPVKAVPPLGYTPAPAPDAAPQPAPVYPEAPVWRPAEPAADLPAQRRPMWILGLVSGVVSFLFVLCVVIGLAVAPAFDKTVPSLPPEDADRQDITIEVQEAYISEMVDGVLPEGTDGEIALDVRPGNELVTTINFTLLIVRLEVIINAGLAVEDGEVAVSIRSIETGGYDVLDLVGLSEFSLGEEITGRVQEGLEAELGEGARLLAIETDETHVILKARWE